MDTTFGGGDGIVTTNTSAIVDNANAVAIDSLTGNIWVGGTSWGSGNEDFLVLSYDSSGNLNGAFGGGYVKQTLVARIELTLLPFKLMARLWLQEVLAH